MRQSKLIRLGMVQSKPSLGLFLSVVCIKSTRPVIDKFRNVQEFEKKKKKKRERREREGKRRKQKNRTDDEAKI